MRLLLTFTLLLLPIGTSAAVSISEVAWMGSATSANHEWIELYNAGGAAVSVDGWTLSDGMNLEIPLSGTVPPNTYAVLERTSEDSAPGSAFLVYTGALVNTGATLTLRDAASSIMDQVVGGENWQLLGGDNLTKETAQYTTAGWVTDVATPGRVNNTGRTEPPNNEEEEQETVHSPSGAPSAKSSSNSRGANETVSLVMPNTVVTLVPVVQSVAYVNQTIPLTVKASGVGETILNSLQYTWNFGDSYTESGQTVSHAYRYPGTYVITVSAVFGRHAPVARQEITVLPTTLSVTRNEAGDVQLHNNAVYDVDVSGFIVRGEHTVTLPKHTIMLPRGTITLARGRLETAPTRSLIGVYDTAGSLVASTFTDLPKGVTQSAVVPPLPQNTKVKSTLGTTQLPRADTAIFQFSSESRDVVPPAETQAASATTTPAAAVVSSEPAALVSEKAPRQSVWPYLALVLLLVSALAVLFKKPLPNTP